jgi:acyl-coenzyme A synthetase/AMP-(fatty) acid ligase
MSTIDKFNIGFEFITLSYSHPEASAIIQDDLVLSYKQLGDIVISFAVNMQKHGVTAKSIVAINTHDTIVSLASILATSLLGARWIEANKELAQSKVVQPTHFFKSPEAGGSAHAKFVEITPQWGPYFAKNEEQGVEQFEGLADTASAWLIVKTSGTTGYPKYLTLDQETIFKRSKAIGDDFKPLKTRFACFFASGAYPFLTRAIGALLNLSTIVDSRDFNFWKKTGVNLVMGSPLQVHEMLMDVTLKPKLPEIHVAGSKLSDTVARDLLRNFDRVVDVYASTETNRSYKNVKSLDEAENLVTHGQRTDAIVEVTDPQGKPCDKGVIGSVRIKNPYLAKGYLNDDIAQERSFKDGWFYPGDQGSWGEHNTLVIHGRQDDIANVGGVKIQLKLIDLLLVSLEGIEVAASFKNPVPNAPDELIAFVIVSKGSNPQDVIDNFKIQALTSLSGLNLPKRILPVKNIPIGADGAPLRRICEQMVLERKGLLPSVGADKTQ